MFELSFRKRLAQLFCPHDYYPVAMTDSYHEIGGSKHEKVVFYKCRECEHVQISKNDSEN